MATWPPLCSGSVAPPQLPASSTAYSTNSHLEMSTSTYRKAEEMESGAIDKMTVFQNCIASFNQSGVSAKKSRELLKRLVYLMYTGTAFSEDEATQLFFTITKLFQKETPGLRQMIYLAIKELCDFTDNVIMGTSVIMKDVQGAQDQIYRPNAIRTLARIVDLASVESVDRPIRTAIVDRDGSVSSAALVSAYHLLGLSKDTVRRWSTETAEALSSPKAYKVAQGMAPGASAITQYHALGLLYHMRSHDRVALAKLVQQLATAQISLRSPQAYVLLVKYTAQLCEDDPRQRTSLMEYLQGWLRHPSDMVNIEAAKAILGFSWAQRDVVFSAIQTLQAFLGSPRAPSRFAAIRLLNRYAAKNPELVSQCNFEIEHLITDPNRSIATYAITALLKTGSDQSVDRLIEQISGLMDDIGADFKVIVVDAIRSLAIKFPSKHAAMLDFFAQELRNEGGLELKTSIVEALFDIIRASPDTRDDALSNLCEFIEDCEYPELTSRILHMLGAIGPSCENPTQYIRYIYNRVALENSIVRAAAVSALTRFALIPSLASSVSVLLHRCLTDHTDEVRDRAAFGLSIVTLPEASELIAPQKKLNLGQLESALVGYMDDPSNFSKAFDASSIQRLTDEQRREQKAERKRKIEESAFKEPTPEAEPVPTNAYAAELAAIPEFVPFGELLHSSGPQSLTESEMEYVVTAVTHVFANHLVVQLNVDNTFELTLQDVRAEFELDELEESLQEDLFVPIETLEPNSSGTLYVSFERAQGIIVGSLPSKLKFVLDGQEEEYGMDPLEITPGAFIEPTYVGSFQHKWDELPNEETATRQFPQCKTIEDAVQYLERRLGMMAQDSTEIVDSNATSHTLKLYGRVLGKEPVAATVRLVSSARSGIAGKIIVKSEEDAAEYVADGI